MKTSLLGVETTGPGVSSIYRSQSRSCSSKYPSQSTSPYLFFPDKPGISQRRTSSSPTGLPRSCPSPCTSPLAGTRSTSRTVTGLYPKRLRPHFPARLPRPSPPRNCITAPSSTPRGSWPSSDPGLNVCFASPLFSLPTLPTAPDSLLHWPPWILSLLQVVEVHRVVPSSKIGGRQTSTI